MKRPLILYGSSRHNGNSELLAERMLEGIDCSRIFLMERSIKPIVDQRHTPEGFSPVDDDFDAVVREVIAHDQLVFVTPLYWYGMSGLMKNFVDRWSQALRDPRYEFKAALARKEAFVVVVGGDSAPIQGLPLIQQFNYIFDFVGMKFGGYVIGRGGRPGDVLKDEQALTSAAILGRQLSAPGHS